MIKLLLSFFAILVCLEGNSQQNYYSSVLGVNSEPVLFNSITMNTYELLNTSLQLSKDASLQKMVFSPFMLLKKQNQFLNSVKLNLAQKDKISTFGLGLGIDNASPFSGRGETKFKGLGPAIAALGTKPSQGPAEPEHVYRGRAEDYDRALNKILTDYYLGLVKNSVKVTLAYNLSFFEIVGGKDIDVDQDGIVDNKHSTESNNLSLGAIYSYDVKNSVSLNLHYIEKRSGPEDGKKIVPFVGGSFAFASTVFILDKEYETSKDYLRSLFIPSILVGASIEYLRATDNEEEAKDGISKSLVITPFLDFKITSKTQFRLGIPITRRSISKEGSVTSFGPMLQFLLQVADK